MHSSIKIVATSLLLALVTNIDQAQADGITVTLWKHANYRGEQREIYIEDNKCFPLFNSWADQVSSIQLNNNCVQVYDGTNCDGHSAILDNSRPNSAASTNSKNLALTNFNDKVRSLRRC